MKKNIVPKIIFLILLIVLIIMIVISVFDNKPKNLAKKMYENICNKTSYTFSMETENTEWPSSLIVAKKDGKICIDSKVDEEHTSTLVDEEVAYYIMHNDQEYYFYDINQIDADILKNYLQPVKENDYKIGYEKINNKKYYYEEYEEITDLVMTLNYNEESTIKTRFYFDGKNIAYIKTIIGEEEELLKVDFSDTIDENLFNIPDSYAEL